MAEVNSKEAALIAAGSKLKHSSHGKIETIVITTPLVFAELAIADTLATGMIIPKGSRILGVRKSHGTGTAASTFDLGLRRTNADKTVIDMDGLVKVSALTTATTVPLDCGNGDLILGGIDSVTAYDAEVYLTARGAVLAANQAVRIEVDYIGP
jgi:hypothetical protein